MDFKCILDQITHYIESDREECLLIAKERYKDNPVVLCLDGSSVCEKILSETIHIDDQGIWASYYDGSGYFMMLYKFFGNSWAKILDD